MQHAVYLKWSDGGLRFVRLFLLAAGLTLILTACVAPQKYTPTIMSDILDRSDSSLMSDSIPVKVRIVKLVDASPAEDKEDGWIYGNGWSVTSPERLNGELTNLVTEAIEKDLRIHGPFENLAADQQGEQLMLGGTIHRFYQRREQYIWALCCGLLGALLPFPLMKESGEVDLELTLSREGGNTIKSYRAHSSFTERCNFYSSRCWESYNSSPAKFLDRAFGKAIYQIRKQIAQDRELLGN